MRTDGGLRQLMRARIPWFHWVTVETSATAAGVPDCEYCHDGVQGWVENKLTRGLAIDVWPTQVAWIERRIRAGGRVHVAVRRQCAAGPRRGPGCDELWLFNGNAVRALCEREIVLDDVGRLHACGVWYGGPARWDWAAVADVLKSG